MKVEVITIGDELMCGEVLDTNFSWLAERLWLSGYDVQWHTTVPDRPELMREAFLHALRADIAIVTGGLGPTRDDRTLEVAAETFGKKMVEDQDALVAIEKRLKQLGRPSSPAQRKQALHPEGGTMFPNVKGTAPGCRIEYEGTQFIFLVGVPSEMYEQWDDFVFPYLEKAREKPVHYAQRVFRCFGAPEAELEERLKPLKLPNVRLSYRLMFPEVLIKIGAWDEDPRNVHVELVEAEILIRARIGRFIYATGPNPVESIIGESLTQRKETLATAESCTGGLIANMLTDVPGTSAYFERGLITYSNEAKIELLGVAKNSLKDHGAVSAEVAREMAEGVRAKAKTTYGLAVTGIAGPTGGTPEKPVGTVYIALATPDGTNEKEYHFPFGRNYFKVVTAHTALHKLRRFLAKQT